MLSEFTDSVSPWRWWFKHVNRKEKWEKKKLKQLTFPGVITVGILLPVPTFYRVGRFKGPILEKVLYVLPTVALSSFTGPKDQNCNHLSSGRPSARPKPISLNILWCNFLTRGHQALYSLESHQIWIRQWAGHI